jgi:hypothetical protein
VHGPLSLASPVAVGSRLVPTVVTDSRARLPIGPTVCAATYRFHGPDAERRARGAGGTTVKRGPAH